MNIAGAVSHQVYYDIALLLENGQKCFENDRSSFKAGEYTLWTCSEPKPIGRFVYLYIQPSNFLQIYQFVVLGWQTNDYLSYDVLDISNIELLDNQNSFHSSSEDEKYPEKLIDKNFQNTFVEASQSCYIMISTILLTFDKISIVYQIGIVYHSQGIFLFIFFYFFLIS